MCNGGKMFAVRQGKNARQYLFAVRQHKNARQTVFYWEILFAMRPIKCAPQRSKHTVNAAFPIVYL
jgi:hypothetical protein